MNGQSSTEQDKCELILSVEGLESSVLIRQEDQENQFSHMSSLSKLLFQDYIAAGLRSFWCRWVIMLELGVLRSC